MNIITQTDNAVLEFFRKYHKETIFTKIVNLLIKGFGLAPILIIGIVEVENKAIFLYGFLFICIISLISELGIKSIIKRKRPDSKKTSYSFPSTHALATTMGVALILNLASANILLTLILLLYWILVIFMRMYSLYHYLSDIIAGILLGSLTIQIYLLILQQ